MGRVQWNRQREKMRKVAHKVSTQELHAILEVVMLRYYGRMR